MPDEVVKALPCGCQARTYRDVLGRVVGTITAKGPACQKNHDIGQTVIMPGREHARPE